MRSPIFATLVCTLSFFASLSLATPTPLKRADSVAFHDPRARGGALLNRSGGLGEPLNVIISGKSSPEILTKNGFLDYARAVGFSMECFGQHRGDPQPANLGDGNGWRGEREVLRQHFAIPLLGTCLQSLTGGNHFRVYQQDGPEANSGALFLAVSEEKDLANNHQIVPNGYNIGRDLFVNGAVGTKRFLLHTYTTTVEEVRGLLEPGSEGVNHGIAQDGVVKVLTVTRKFSLF
ncbi:hypothetical protein FA15DRAFT_676274 [Coprinopsis marcescibilis]|uniref:Uncharacterized protein n=1 Tax=Coprinopsis marcescibilis TaxID=230819 RepID=A0A5C3KB61_COPMA|nr:hypothetical protein FA15DRAFT_676274 [Coprinopsis marcescibilis]